MTEPLDVARRRRWPWLIGIGAPLLVVVAIALALFQPWQLFIDETVDDAAPVGAAPIGAPATTPTSDVPTSPPEPATEATEATAAETSTQATAAPPATIAPTTVPSTRVASAPPPMFVSLDHATSGSLVLLEDADGRRFARIEDLATDQGPDVFVYLSTNPVDGPEEAFDDDVVNLGSLQGNLGNQNYEIPGGIDLGRYRSLVIWCDRFDSAFGAVALPA